MRLHHAQSSACQTPCCILFSSGTTAEIRPLMDAPIVQKFIASILQLSIANGTNSLLIGIGVCNQQTATMSIIYQSIGRQIGQFFADCHDFVEFFRSVRSAQAGSTAYGKAVYVLRLDHSAAILPQHIQRCKQNHVVSARQLVKSFNASWKAITAENKNGVSSWGGCTKLEGAGEVRLYLGGRNHPVCSTWTNCPREQQNVASHK